MADYITTFSKVHFTPLEPKKEELKIEDIVHALTFMTRANGHFPEFYSVAQHSIHCCEEAIGRGYEPEVVLACLLHDASEAYVADITRPVKKHLSQYLEVEKKIQDAVFERFVKISLTKTQLQLVSKVDDTLLYYEFLHYMGEALQDKKPFMVKNPEFKEVPFEEVRETFMFYFDKFTLEVDKVLGETKDNL